MIPEELTKANSALATEVKALQGKVAIHEQLILLCLDMVKNFGFEYRGIILDGMVKNFGHFVPTAVLEFNKEFERIRGGEDNTLSNLGERGDEDDQRMSDKKIDTYLDNDPTHPENLEE